jgi:hypothetical protein
VLAPPYLDIRGFISGCVETLGFDGPLGASYNLAVLLSEGWYVAPRVVSTASDDIVLLSNSEFSLRDVIPGGAPEILLTVHSTRDFMHHAETLVYLVVAGIGPSGKPSAIPGMAIGYLYPFAAVAAQSRARWPLVGTLELSDAPREVHGIAVPPMPQGRYSLRLP